MALLSNPEHLVWPFKRLFFFFFLDLKKRLRRINELLQSGLGDNRPFIGPELFLFMGAGAGAGAGLIRDRPAADLSLSERLADPCCLIGKGSLLTRAYQQWKQTGMTSSH